MYQNQILSNHAEELVPFFLSSFFYMAEGLQHSSKSHQGFEITAVLG